jgi:hypothetical protein
MLITPAELMKKYTDGAFCPAGMNSFVIAPKGDVFYCMADLESNRNPAFNLSSRGKLLTSLLPY